MLFLAVIMFSFVSISQVIVEKAECFAPVGRLAGRKKPLTEYLYCVGM